MALVAANQFGAQAGKYLAASAVNAIANKIGDEIQQHLTVNNLSKLVQGKRRNNKGRQNARNQMLRAKFSAIPRQLGVAPVALNYRSQNFRSKPSTTNYRVHNREFVTDVTTSITGTYKLLQPMSVQPGLTSSFPWLSRIAQSHQKYRFSNLRFTYQPLCGTSTPGRVVIAFARDALDSFPTTAAQIYQYPQQCDSSLWGQCELTVPSSQFEVLYTRGDAVFGSDLKTYDNGVFYVATFGNPQDTETSVGSIFVEYDVELITPQPIVLGDPSALVIDPANGDGDEVWFDEGLTPVSGQPFGLSSVSSSTLKNGLAFNKLGWFCIQTIIFATTITGGIQIQAPRSDFAVVTTTDTVSASGKTMTTAWVNILKLSNAFIAQIKFAPGSVDGITSIGIMVTPMPSGSPVSFSF